MKWCQPHWNELREAIRVRGLDGFGAQNAEQAAADCVAQIDGEQTAFDPLMGSFWEINNQAMGIIGLRLMGQCPFCLMVADGRPELVAEWITAVTDSAKKYAIEQGLVRQQ